MASDMKVEQCWVDGNQLFVKVSSSSRGELTDTIRQFVSAYVMNPSNNLSGWASAGVEKCECPISFDPEQPDADPVEISKTAAAAGKKINWRYSQVVKLTRGI